MKNKLILSIALFAIGILVAGSAPAVKVAASGTWSSTDSMAAARQYHTATTLQDGTVLVAGGCDNVTVVVARYSIPKEFRVEDERS